MADAGEDQDEAQRKTESSSMKGQTSDVGTKESDERTDPTHEAKPRSWAENKGLAPDAGTTRDHTESKIGQQQGARDFQMQRSGSQRRSDDRNAMRHEVAQSSEHPVCPSDQDCPYYLRGRCTFGRKCKFNHPNELRAVCEHYLQFGWCRYGSNCSFNHPTHIQPVKFVSGSCKRGFCKNELSCRYSHIMETDEAEPRSQEIPENRDVNALGQENLQRGIERQRGEAEDQEELDKKRKRDEEIANERRENRRKIEEVKPTVRFNDAQGLTDEFDDIVKENQK